MDYDTRIDVIYEALSELSGEEVLQYRRAGMVCNCWMKVLPVPS